MKDELVAVARDVAPLGKPASAQWKARLVRWVNVVAFSVNSALSLEVSNYDAALGWFVAGMYALMLLLNEESK